MWTFADNLSKDMVGPPLWFVGGLVGVVIGVVSGLVACLLARPKEVPDAEIVNDLREVRALRYLLGVLLALFGAVIGGGFVLDAIHAVMLRYLGTW